MAGHAWLILAVILHGLVYFFLLPPWMGEDEPWHLEYARDLALPRDDGSSADLELSPSQRLIHERTRAEPREVVRTQAEIVASMRRHHFWRRVDFAGWEHGASTMDHFVLGHTEAHQPPLYYHLCALALRVAGIGDVEAQLWFLRALSFLCYLATLFFTYALARLVTEQEWIAAAAVLVVAWLPMHARQAAMVNNDVLVKVFAAATLWLAGLHVLGRGGRAATAAMILCAGLALATKPTAIGITAPLWVALGSSWGRGKTVPARLLAGTLVALVLLGGALLYWTLSGTRALPLSTDLGQLLHSFTLAAFHHETLRTFVGTFNWYTRDLPAATYAAVLVAIAAGLLLSLVAAARRADLQRRIIALCWLAIVCQFLAMGLRGFAAGRFFFPVLPALGTLVAVGWIAPFPPRRRHRGAILLASALVLYDGFALWNGLFPHQYLDWGS